MPSYTPRAVIDAVNTAGRTQPEPAKTAVAEIVAALSDRKSVWHDLDVLCEITDRFQPRPGIRGERWAGVLDRALGQVIDACVGLDPDQSDDEAGRGSDGRSV